jgi:hypothetical protein
MPIVLANSKWEYPFPLIQKSWFRQTSFRALWNGSRSVCINPAKRQSLLSLVHDVLMCGISLEDSFRKIINPLE